MSGSIGVICPHCNNRTWLNSRRNLSPLLTTMYAVCQNPTCLASFTVIMEITKQNQTSLAPAPEIAAQLSKKTT